MTRVRFNSSKTGAKTVSASIKTQINDLTEEGVKQELIDIAQYATNISKYFVDTGAYITSFSILPAGSGSGRRRSSKNKPRNQDPEAKRAEAMSNLISDISKLDFEIGKNFVIRNRAPHAVDVENGWPSGKPGYGVMRRIAARFS